MPNPRWATLAVVIPLCCTAGAVAAEKSTPVEPSEETLECNECHADQTAGIYQEWGSSKHFRANVGCWECHRAEPGDADAFEHMGQTISIIVSPRDYTKFIPELREVAERSAASADSARVAGGHELEAAIDELLARPEHAWYLGKLSAEEEEKRKKAREEFQQRYAGE